MQVQTSWQTFFYFLISGKLRFATKKFYSIVSTDLYRFLDEKYGIEDSDEAASPGEAEGAVVADVLEDGPCGRAADGGGAEKGQHCESKTQGLEN